MGLVLKYDMNSRNVLPLEYQEVAYIESTGTLYINTNFYINLALNFIINFKFDTTNITDNSSWRSIFGYRTGGSSALCIFVLLSSLAVDYYGGGNFTISPGIQTVCITNTKVTVNGLSKNATWTYPRNVTRSETPLWIGLGSGNPGIRQCPIKIYRCSIDNAGTLCDYVPCYRKSDNKPGMFDIINLVFYTNSGTGEFILGPNVVSLPDDFLQVEYLQNTGSEYLYINKSLETNDIITTNVSYLLYATATTILPTFLGSDKTNKILLYVVNQRFSHWGAITLNTNLSTSPTLGKRYNINATMTNTCSSFYLFRYSETSHAFIGRLETVTVMRGTTKVLELVPCYLKSSMVTGMYDTVSNTFYAYSKSGLFIAGHPVYGHVEQSNDGICDLHIEPDLTKWTKESGISCTVDSNGWYKITDSTHSTSRWGIYKDIDLVPNTTYTIFVDLKAGTSLAQLGGGPIAETGSAFGAAYKNHTSATEVSYIQTFNSGTRPKARIYLCVKPTDTNLYAYFKNIKVFKGNTTSYNFNTGAVLTNIGYSTSNPEEILGINHGSFQFNSGYMLTNLDLSTLFNSRVYSLSFWFNPSELPSNEDPSTWKRLFCCRKNNDNQTYHLLVVYLTKTSIGTSFFGNDTAKVIPNLKINTWYFATLLLNGNTQTIYINGKSLGTNTKSTSAIVAGAHLDFGKCVDRNMGQFKGMMCDFRIYDNVLTNDDILQLYADKKGGII